MAVSLSATILMTAEHGPVNERLWTLVLELSAQLAANKQQVDALRNQVASLEGQALHAKTGYALRRFNVDMSQEAFTSQLERLNAQLVNENTTLAYEAKQMGSLLRESESTLEAIMNKFRAFSHAAQQHGLDLSAYYESRIESQRNRIDHLVMHDQDTMHRLSDRVSGLVRDAMHSMDSDFPDMCSDAMEGATELERLRQENAILRSLMGLSHEDADVDDNADRVSTSDLSISRSSLGHAEQPVEESTTTGTMTSEGEATVDEIDAGVPAPS